MQERQITLNGRYQLLERIGSGGMSVVYKGHDLSLGRIVAVKMMHESLTSDDTFRQRFRQEAHAVANLTHPNIVTVHDIGHDQHRHYMVMEYIEGLTLKQIIRQEYEGSEKTLPINRALDLIIQTCAGVGYAHRAHLIHCDIKPQNILVTRDDRVKVADFGIARAVSESSLPQEGVVWGTPQYFSPEQAAGKTPTPASDVYAIGIVLFELLSGHLPFAAENYTAMALKHINEPPPLVTQYNPAVPTQLEQIIDKVLAKEPAGRYRTAGQLGRILSSYRQSSQADTGVITISTPPTETVVPTSEQKTQIFQRPEPTSAKPTPTVPPPTIQIDHAHIPIPPAPTPLTERPTIVASAHTSQPTPAPSPPSQSTPTPAPSSQPPTTPDWVIISLGITALIFLLGLIPLWYLAYRAWAG